MSSDRFRALLEETALFSEGNPYHAGWEFVRISEIEMHPDPTRVISKPFLHGQEISLKGYSRAAAVINRIMAIPEGEILALLRTVVASFNARHRDLEAVLEGNFQMITRLLPDPCELSWERRMLIGAYFTQEYAVESAALFNPSIVPHPNQTGLPNGALRFIMSLRGVGEGHVSCIEFRTGIIDATGSVAYDDVKTSSGYLVTPTIIQSHYSREVFREQYAELSGSTEDAEFITQTLPDEFLRADLDRLLGWLGEQELTRGARTVIIERLARIADCNYTITFPEQTRLSERIITPYGLSELNGMEDVRMVHLLNADGTYTYYGTYTAYDGKRVAPQMFVTDDFLTFRMFQIAGNAAKDKGVAVFPRKVNGRYMALSRWDKENNLLASSSNLTYWEDEGPLITPEFPWDLFQMGNCGSPIETEAGWIVLTHGVGSMREYSIGVALLDLDDPSVVLGKLERPLLTSTPLNRDGYVPNVVYSCGALLYGETLILPHGCNDTTVRIALINLPELLRELTRSV